MLKLVKPLSCLFSLIILGISPLYAKSPKHSCYLPNNPLCQKIMKLAPHIGLNYALRISTDFYLIGKKYDLPAPLLIAIAMQESTFRLNAIRKVKGYVLKDKGNYEVALIGTDFCMMQINISNIIHYKLDPRKLVEDSYYCIQAGAKILNATMNRFKGKEQKWWTRYNSSNPVHRKNYGELVLNYWRKIDPVISEDFQNIK